MILAFVLLAALHAPEDCLGRGFSTQWQGKTYTFRFEDCRDEFLKDPERYAQLYDTLLEMQAEGMKVEPPKASLVPS